MFRSKVNRLLLTGADAAAAIVRPVMNRVARHQAKDISLERQRNALASTVEFVRRHMPNVPPVASKYDLLTRAFQRADTSGDKLVCEFGVFRGSTLNHIASMTPKTVFGFDSFEGLPEQWGHGIAKGHFAVKKLPDVRKNVTLVKGWFHETLPAFLAQNQGMIGFVHIDCDLYSSTKIVFDLLEKRISAGTVIAFDEYFNYPDWQEGEHKAFNEFLSRAGFSFEAIGYHTKAEQVAVVITRI